MVGLRKRLASSEFFRHVLTIMMGTGVGQVLSLAASPFLTRLYDPKDFGLFAIFFSISSILTVVSTGRYEIAIMAAQAEEEAVDLTKATIVLCFIFCLFSAVALYIFGEKISIFINMPSIDNYLVLVPLSAMIAGSYQSLTYLSMRDKGFRNISNSRISQSVATVGGQISSSSILSGGLIFGSIFGQVASAAYLCTVNWNRLIKRPFSKGSLVPLYRKYSAYPKYSVVGALLDTASVQLPMLVISKVYEPSSVGQFSLVMRVLGMPAVLVASAFGQVLFQKVSFLQRENPQRVRSFILKSAMILFLLNLPLVFIMIFGGEFIFSTIFGWKWREAGSFSSVLIWAMSMRFVVSPLSAVLAAAENVKIGTFWQISYFFTAAIALYYGSQFDIKTFIVIFTVHEVVQYLVYFSLIIRYSAPAYDRLAKGT